MQPFKADCARTLEYSKNMCSNSSEVAGEEPSEHSEDTNLTYSLRGKRYKVVAKRWGVLALVCCILLPDMFSFGFFAFINDLTSFYFRIIPAVADLQSTVNLIGRILTSVIICLIAELLNFRNITVLGSALNVLASGLVTIGVVLKIYGLVLAGMFVCGCASAIAMSLIMLVAVLWFPFKERGRANAATWVARRVAYLLSSLISTRGMGVSYSYAELQEVAKFANETQNVEYRFQVAFSSVFGFLALISVVCCVISQLYLSDGPPVYENNPQARSAVDENSSILGKEPEYSFKRTYKELTMLLSNCPFVLISFIYGISITERPLGSILASSLVLHEFPHVSDQLVGVMVAVGVALSSLCSLLAGQILDKYSKPRLTYIVIMVVSMAALVAFSVCFQFHVLNGVFATFLIMWSTRDGVLVCMTHRLSGIIAHQSDSIRVKAFTLPTVGTAFWGAMGTTFMRLLLENFNSAIAVLFPLPFLLFGLFSYVFLWSYLRDPM